MVSADNRLLLASSLRQLRKMLYTAADDGEGTCCLMSTRSRKAGSWRRDCGQHTILGYNGKTRITNNGLNEVACAAHQNVGETAKTIKSGEKLIRSL